MIRGVRQIPSNPDASLGIPFRPGQVTGEQLGRQLSGPSGTEREPIVGTKLVLISPRTAAEKLFVRVASHIGATRRPGDGHVMGDVDRWIGAPNGCDPCRVAGHHASRAKAST
jgi:hypothetical protein